MEAAEKLTPRKSIATNLTEVKNMKFAQAITIGHSEKLFITNSKYDIGIQGNLIVRVQDKMNNKDVAFTTLMNVVCWHV